MEDAAKRRRRGQALRPRQMARACPDVERLGRTLDPALRARVDAIGMDDQELLHVPDDAVLMRLQELEREGERELARAVNGARVIRRKRTR